MFGPYFKFISHIWHVLPPGFLFVLGLDTASEISLLSLSSGASQQAISFVGIISLPILFAAGMSLLDTLDGILMISAYNWAFFSYSKNLLQYYNYCYICYRCAIGTVELLQILVDKLQLKGSIWEFIENIQFDNIGYILVILFIISWLISTLIWKFGKVEQRWS